jgi:hypothetical protein
VREQSILDRRTGGKMRWRGNDSQQQWQHGRIEHKRRERVHRLKTLLAMFVTKISVCPAHICTRRKIVLTSGTYLTGKLQDHRARVRGHY